MSEALDQATTTMNPAPAASFVRQSEPARQILYSMCEWGRENPAVWAPQIANTWRVTNDIFDGFRSITTRAGDGFISKSVHFI